MNRSLGNCSRVNFRRSSMVDPMLPAAGELERTGAVNPLHPMMLQARPDTP